MLDYNKLLPKIISKVVAENDISPAKLPFTQSIKAGVLFTDVTGFTKMTEMVSRGGHYSVEIITELLNSYFEEMYKCIDNYDGDLIKYGGDSILAIFPGEEDSARFRMKACLLDMKSSLENLNIQLKETYSLEIDFHCNIAWGQVNINIVGSIAHHLDYFITGDTIEQLFTAEDYNLNFKLDKKEYIKQENNIKADNNDLAHFFPVLTNKWLQNNKFRGELKNSAVIFVKVENSDNNNREIELSNYHDFYLKLQNIVYSYEGTINKIDYTDKGYLILITFGVPFLHNDDIERAFICSTEISKLFQKGIKTKIGLTYNNIYSGILGASQRYEYGIIGNAVNISARLMSESAYNDFTFSSEIVPHIQGRYETELIDTVSVKGIAKEIKTYHIINELSDFWSAYQDSYGSKKLFGYDSDLKDMENSQLICISGSSGSGKSHLIYEYLKPKVAERIPISLFVLSEYEKLKPFSIFYKMINENLKVNNILTDFSLLKEFVVEQNLKLDLDIIHDYFTENSNEIKAKLSSIVYDLLTEIIIAINKDRLIFVIENWQWIDTQSCELLKKLIPKFQVEKKKIILTANNLDLYNDFSFYSPLIMEMKDFNLTQAKEFFNSEELIITDNAIKQILVFSHSNPAYISEIGQIIKLNWNDDKGFFDTGDFQVLVRNGKLPKSFETILLNDFEALDNDTKQLLKYASIMGVSFSVQLLDIFSTTFIQEHIETVLAKLTNNRHIFKKLILPEVEYFFNNSLMRDAIYRTILLKEKQSLHLTIANYYLNNFQDDLPLYYEVIANHFIMAKAKKKAVKWCKLAAEKNYKISAYGVSDYYYTQALSFCSGCEDVNELLMALVAVNIEQNKAQEVAEYLDKIEFTNLSEEQIDLYYLYKIRLYGLQKNFKLFMETYHRVKTLIRSEEVLLRIKLVSFDYYRMNNSLELFNELKEELREKIVSQSTTFSIIYYSILGQFYLDRAEYALAEDNYLKLNQLALDHDKKLYLRISATSLGIIQVRKGDQVKALEYFNSALNIAEDIGDKHGYAKVSTEMAMIYFAQGLDDQAISTLDNCLNIAKYIGDKQQEQTVLYNIGYIYHVIQEYDTAIKYLSQAIDIAKLIDDKVGIAYANDGLADAYFLQQKFGEAKRIYEQNLKLQKELQDKEGIAHTIGNLANILREEKNYPKALEYYQIQFDSLHKIGDKVGEGKALFNWGITLDILGDSILALEKLQQAFNLFVGANDINYAEFTKQQIERIKDKLS